MSYQYQITKIKSDINGNPRRVVHHLAFVTDADRAEFSQHKFLPCSFYEFALRKARKFGGRKYHNKQFGGGIVFQAYSDAEVYDIIEKANAQ